MNINNECFDVDLELTHHTTNYREGKANEESHISISTLRGILSR